MALFNRIVGEKMNYSTKFEIEELKAKDNFIIDSYCFYVFCLQCFLSIHLMYNDIDCNVNVKLDEYFFDKIDEKYILKNLKREFEIINNFKKDFYDVLSKDIKKNINKNVLNNEIIKMFGA